MGLLEAASEAHISSLRSEWGKALREQGIEDRNHAVMILKEIMWVESIQGKRYLQVQDRFGVQGRFPLLPTDLGEE